MKVKDLLRSKTDFFKNVKKHIDRVRNVSSSSPNRVSTSRWCLIPTSSTRRWCCRPIRHIVCRCRLSMSPSSTSGWCIIACTPGCIKTGSFLYIVTSLRIVTLASLRIVTLTTSLHIVTLTSLFLSLLHALTNMVHPMSFLVLALLFIFFNPSLASSVTYNVLNLGAKSDGKTDSTKAFLSAWTAACGSETPATIYVPLGRFLLQNAVFRGQCKNSAITIRIDGTLVAPSDYSVVGNAGNWLLFEHVNGVSINGGTLDGQGTGLWDCKASGKSCPSGATSLEFTNSNNIVINGLTSLNSQKFHIVINGCQNVKLQGVKVSASGNSPNTDGIHVQQSTGVTILGANIKTGDDCVSIGPGTTNLWIENVACGPGHGISIGSLGKELQEAGVQNVTVKTVTFTGSQNGVRIKAWGRPSSGFVKGVLFQHALMVNVENPIVIDQNYCPDNEGCPGQASGVKISDVTYQDVHGTSATEVAVKFDCSSKSPCSDIILQDVKLTYKNQAAEASCVNAGGTASGLVVPTSCL